MPDIRADLSLIDTIITWAWRVTVANEETPGGWRVTVRYNGDFITFDYDLPDGFQRQPLDAIRAISTLWSMTAVARKYRPIEEFARFMRSENDEALAVKYAEWSRISHGCVALFGEAFGDSSKAVSR